MTVRIYTRDYKMVKAFETVEECAVFLGVSVDSVKAAVRNHNRCQGYRITKEEDKYSTPALLERVIFYSAHHTNLADVNRILRETIDKLIEI